MQQVDCAECHGTGSVPSRKGPPKVCTHCKGTGKFVLREQANGQVKVTKRLVEA